MNEKKKEEVKGEEHAVARRTAILRDLRAADAGNAVDPAWYLPYLASRACGHWHRVWCSPRDLSEVLVSEEEKRARPTHVPWSQAGAEVGAVIFKRHAVLDEATACTEELYARMTEAELGVCVREAEARHALLKVMLEGAESDRVDAAEHLDAVRRKASGQMYVDMWEAGKLHPTTTMWHLLPRTFKPDIWNLESIRRRFAMLEAAAAPTYAALLHSLTLQELAVVGV